ncbi:hypothetical protein [Hyphococcus sp.]|uniref:hypothetical protein n=1 Tax=Hyphococcus sp. TaxID=2038636 RepID=UPI00207E89C7|nr:MAG: hypothetical protein DHS20C04_12600 [Marinicaulis sp.]
MLFKKLAVCLSFAAISACASSPQTFTTASINPYDIFALDHMSRVEIAENLTIKSRSLELKEEPFLASTVSSDITEAHQRVAVRAESNSSHRLQNKINTGDGTSFYVQTQNSFQQDGWTIDNNRLRHLDSGLLCPQAISISEEGRSFSLERVVEFDEQGRDVACLYQAADNGDVIAAYASYWPDIELEEHVVAEVQGILQNNAVTAQVQLPVVALKAEADASELDELVNGMEEPLAGGFDIGMVNGVPYRTSLWLVKTHGWHVKLRAMYPSADQSTELLSAIHFMASHLAVRAKNLAEPIVPGVDV